MSGRYLTELADVCRTSGLTVLEQNGWQTRARSSGGYADGRPSHCMVHHTASGPSADGWPDADYCSFTSDIRPVANLYLDRSGSVYVLAAGCTNTNGSGSDPCGTVPDDSMNTHALGIEAGNNGVGEPWPEAQQNAYIVLVSTLCAAYEIPSAACHSHAEWTTRKIDPAGPSRWAPGGGTWPMDGFRAELGGTTPAPPTPTTGGFADAMFCTDADTGEFWIVTTDWEGQWAAPIKEIPQLQWELIGPVNDVINGPLKPVPHASLQAIYDERGRPATP